MAEHWQQETDQLIEDAKRMIDHINNDPGTLGLRHAARFKNCGRAVPSTAIRADIRK
jgi:hypothetical protein